jgi:hypothetical protein
MPCRKQGLQKSSVKVGNQVEEYLDSYHGLAAARGYEDAALCVDCHESHSILRSTNEEASTHVQM